MTKRNKTNIRATNEVAEPLRDVIGRAIYAEPLDWHNDADWYDLSEELREKWRCDADRVITALLAHWTPKMQSAAEESGADFLANSPRELWKAILECA